MYEAEFFEEGYRLTQEFCLKTEVAQKQLAEGEVHPEVLEEIMRSAHTLKGIAGLVGFQELADVAKAAEYTADAMRLGKARISDGGFLCLRDVGVLVESMLKAAESDSPIGTDDIQQSTNRLKEIRQDVPEIDSPDVLMLAGLSEERMQDLDEYAIHRMRYNLKKGRSLYEVVVVFSIETFDVELERVEKALRELSEIISNRPSATAHAGASIGFDLIVATENGRDALQQALALPEAKIDTYLTPPAQ